MKIQKVIQTVIAIMTSITIFGCVNQQKNKDQDLPIIEQAVIIHFFEYGSTDLTRLFSLEDKIEKIIKDNNLGEYDGNEIAVDGSDGYMYMYGPDAKKIFDSIKPILLETSFMKNAKIKLRFGPPDDNTNEEEFILN